MFFINTLQHAEGVIGPKADFPGGLEWGGLPQRLTIAHFLVWFELQLLFNLRANERVVLREDRAQLLLGCLVVAYLIRLLACHVFQPLIRRSRAQRGGFVPPERLLAKCRRVDLSDRQSELIRIL